jgi:hypothetical protein
MSLKRVSLKLVLSLAFLLVWLANDEAQARRWTVNRKRLDGELVTVAGNQVIVRLRNGRVREIPAADLSADDLNFVQALLALGNNGAAAPAAPAPAVIAGNGMARVESLLESSLTYQAAQFRSQWYDLWIVQFVRPDGFPYWVAVFARDSYTATRMAVSRDSMSRLLFVKRLNRR